ncbi:hypothetical protein [Deminuibacter soli]|uniref:Uncharacterized protein n=1 Tax=Deminuibacter soli TaxID=2291815 RepID=A0A3E1NQ69_9BACT|nr:hypothetical protein [Deminuibacter soli]RFM30060.1 hypothetical protein DXN05_03550 [Deminuibacter soli]
MVRNKEIFIEVREQQAYAFCNQCGVNWSSLESQDAEGDEQYEYCPQCKSDHALEPGHAGECFYYSAIEGKVFSLSTGLPKVTPAPFVPVKPERGWEPKKWLAQTEQRDKTELDALDAYVDCFFKNGPEAAETAYFKTFKKTQK